MCVLKAICLRFHDNYGKNIKLSKNYQTSQKMSSDTGDGIVMSRDPMLTNMLYQVMQMYLFACLSGSGVGTDRGQTDFSSCDVRVLRRFTPLSIQ